MQDLTPFPFDRSNAAMQDLTPFPSVGSSERLPDSPRTNTGLRREAHIGSAAARGECRRRASGAGVGRIDPAAVRADQLDQALVGLGGRDVRATISLPTNSAILSSPQPT